ncbi:restriction system protein [Nonomuraea muscovyensis]|uniref:Restriction system protein n=1 Tax=Nonomuraea muscovyensis TaxID=1124761 RepID=A0A7X0BYU8_9ACTN|nr:restriction endonuclease [Nonomuraea muscovyensis]MBB6345208.1 restriction system protein [Nonomuraea muscovyensis]
MGRQGEQENLALDEGLALIGWPELHDLSACKSLDALRDLVTTTYPDATKQRAANWTGQLWTFLSRMQAGDLVVLPLKSKPAIAVGRITGSYTYRIDLPAEARHARPVTWLRTEVARTAIGQDLRHSLGSLLTVCELTRNNAYERLLALASGASDPGVGEEPLAEHEEETDTEVTKFDLERMAQDEIVDRISQRFPGHRLSQLVAAIFQAKGMTTFIAPDGKDGGIDVLAGSGPLGMDPPRICVQVKFTQAPADVRVVREIQGVAGHMGADQVLVVSWNGVTRDAERELRQKFFNVRLWTSDDVLRELSAVYDRLPEEIQADLPLKRVWMLALDA